MATIIYGLIILVIIIGFIRGCLIWLKNKTKLPEITYHDKKQNTLYRLNKALGCMDKAQREVMMIGYQEGKNDYLFESMTKVKLILTYTAQGIENHPLGSFEDLDIGLIKELIEKDLVQVERLSNPIKDFLELEEERKNIQKKKEEEWLNTIEPLLKEKEQRDQALKNAREQRLNLQQSDNQQDTEQEVLRLHSPNLFGPIKPTYLDDMDQEAYKKACLNEPNQEKPNTFPKYQYPLPDADNPMPKNQDK